MTFQGTGTTRTGTSRSSTLISATEAVGVEGLRAKARALQFCGVSEDSEATRAIAGSLADDVLRLYPTEVS